MTHPGADDHGHGDDAHAAAHAISWDWLRDLDISVRGRCIRLSLAVGHECGPECETCDSADPVGSGGAP